MVSDQKFGMTKKKVINLLERLAANAQSPDVKAALEIAAFYVGRCPDCLGSGEKELEDKPYGPHRQKVTSTGKIRYFITCRFCDGGKIKIRVNCNSCGASEDMIWDAKSNKYCQKCAEVMKRKGVL